MVIDKRIIKTNNAILDAFIDLAQTTPLEKITVTALAKKAHISRKTFYDRYSNLDELINTLQNYMAKRFEHLFILPVKNDHELKPDAVMEFLQFAEDNKELLSILKHAAGEFLQAAIDQEGRSMANFLEKDLNFSRDSATTLAPWLITSYIQGSGYLIDKWLFTDNDLTKEDICHLLMLLYSDSIFMLQKKSAEVN
ncbi:TetR/AcrR family transcriptional regulator [Companilactobacillus furfuricola]|uniref:TetR/AcrR family transcriptional regulator n=1 Tax=Companilactobacillus furfuricola TaxID=1462575 RepID=UPI000F79A168|nr:TetR/AcrR family transcriptional regulator [Companilactobacillus furfuricola]